MTRDCKHGQLARSCEVCELEAEVERLRAALRLYAVRTNWHYERLGSERVHPNEVNLYSWEGIKHEQPWQIARDALKDGDA